MGADALSDVPHAVRLTGAVFLLLKAGLLKRRSRFSGSAPKRLADQLLILKAPRAVPIIARRMLAQIVDAPKQSHRRSVGRDGFEDSVQRGARLLPLLRPVGRKPVGIARS